MIFCHLHMFETQFLCLLDTRCSLRRRQRLPFLSWNAIIKHVFCKKKVKDNSISIWARLWLYVMLWFTVWIEGRDNWPTQHWSDLCFKAGTQCPFWKAVDQVPRREFQDEWPTIQTVLSGEKEFRKRQKVWGVRATRETSQAEDVPQLQQSTHTRACMN